MVKGWADHCSSDEEDELGHNETPHHPSVEDSSHKHDDEDDEEHPPVADGDHGEKEHPQQQQQQQQRHHQRNHHHHRQQRHHQRQPRTYEFPTEPPFTAYVGNLAFSVDKQERLVEEMTALAKLHLDLDIQIVNARIAFDTRGEKPRPRGFGYVTVETLEQLQALMKLNQVPEGVMLGGRRIHVDTANRSTNNTSNNNRDNSNNGKNDDIDGSKFRGGRHSNRESSHRRGSNRDNSKEEQDTPPAQRVSLKLAPRSKPRQGNDDQAQAQAKNLSSASNIFGSGRARNEQDWHERKKTTDEQEQHQQHHRNNAGSRASTTAAGSGKDRRGSGHGGKERHRHHNSKDRDIKQHNKTSSQNKQTEEKKVVTPVPQPKAEPPKAVTKVSNTFAALDFSDSDSD